MLTLNETRLILKAEEDLGDLRFEINAESKEKNVRRQHLALLNPFADKRSPVVCSYSARCFEKLKMSDKDVKEVFDIVTTFYQYPASKQAHPQFTREELQPAVNVILTDAAHIFEKACRYKEECKSKWEQINNLEGFITSNFDGTTELTFEDALKIRKDLKKAERIVNFISSVNKSMREKFQECGFAVLDGHKAYINLGKYYK